MNIRGREFTDYQYRTVLDVLKSQGRVQAARIVRVLHPFVGVVTAILIVERMEVLDFKRWA